MSDPRASAVRRLARLLAQLQLPEVSEGTSYGAPAFKVRDKSFVVVRDPQVLVLMLPLEHKQLLLEMAPDIYYETDHYKGWPAVLVRLEVIDDAELAHRLTEAWRHKAPKRLAASYDAGRTR